MRDNLKGSTIDNKKNKLILIRKKDIELPIVAKTWQKSTKMDTITLVSEHRIHSHDYIGIEDLKCHILVKWHNMVTKVLMIKDFKPGLLFCHKIALEYAT